MNTELSVLKINKQIIYTAYNSPKNYDEGDWILMLSHELNKVYNLKTKQTYRQYFMTTRSIPELEYFLSAIVKKFNVEVNNVSAMFITIPAIALIHMKFPN